VRPRRRASAPACFREGDLDLPPPDEGADDLQGTEREIGCEERLGLEAAERIAPEDHRSGSTGRPPWGQTAGPVASSTSRRPSPYQPAMVTRCQAVVASVRTADSSGSRSPVTRGRPFVPGRRGGTGVNSRASSRRRVMHVICAVSAPSRVTRGR